MKKEFRKLSRLELVELIYRLRKENDLLEKRCRKLQLQLKESEEERLDRMKPTEEILSRIVESLDELKSSINEKLPDKEKSGSVSLDESGGAQWQRKE